MPLERSVSQNNAFALRKLVELADQGAKNTLARSFKYLWTGEKSNLPKNRQKAVALLDKNPNDKHVNVFEACRRLPNIVLRRQRKAAIQVAARHLAAVDLPLRQAAHHHRVQERLTLVGFI